MYWNYIWITDIHWRNGDSTDAQDHKQALQNSMWMTINLHVLNVTSHICSCTANALQLMAAPSREFQLRRPKERRCAQFCQSSVKQVSIIHSHGLIFCSHILLQAKCRLWFAHAMSMSLAFVHSNESSSCCVQCGQLGCTYLLGAHQWFGVASQWFSNGLCSDRRVW